MLKSKVDPKKTVSSFHVTRVVEAATAATRAEVFGKLMLCRSSRDCSYH